MPGRSVPSGPPCSFMLPFSGSGAHRMLQSLQNKRIKTVFLPREGRDSRIRSFRSFCLSTTRRSGSARNPPETDCGAGGNRRGPLKVVMRQRWHPGRYHADRARSMCSGPRCKLLSFSRNFGHQTAITAGWTINVGTGDRGHRADLQDPPEVIAEWFPHGVGVYEVVYARRIERKGETAFKSGPPGCITACSGADHRRDPGRHRGLPPDRRKVRDALLAVPEHNR